MPFGLGDVHDDRIDEIKRQCAAEFERLKRSRDQAYTERNQIVALLARLYPSGTRNTAISGWDKEWHGCVWLDLPTGQASWHYHDTDAELFETLPAYEKPWGGHSTPEKYSRVNQLWARIDKQREDDKDWGRRR